MAEGHKNTAEREAYHERAVEAVARGYAKPRRNDFGAGFRAGAEWAEEHGDCSLVKLFVDATHEAEAEPHCTCGTEMDVDDCERHPLGPVVTLRKGRAVEDDPDPFGQLND